MNITTKVYAKSQPLAIGADTKQPANEFVWMPAGTHEIEASGYAGPVVCDAKAAQAIIESYQRVLAAGRKSFVDFNHSDGEAAGWITGFSWDEARGIVAACEWTPAGVQALQEKRFYSFSPAFSIERETGRVTGLEEGHACGGLVNAPAFGSAMPELIAAKHELNAAKNESKKLSDALAAERAKRIDDKLEPAVTAGLITRNAAEGLRVACKAAPDQTDVILASIPARAAAAPAVIVSHDGGAVFQDFTPTDLYSSYMDRLKKSRT